MLGLFIYQAYGTSVFIIVPGTWSSKAAWHQPGSDFFEALKQSAQLVNASVLTFTWSGRNNHEERVKAAQALATLITQQERVYLVTHSHGSNVAFLASHLLAQQKYYYKIIALYSLAAPVTTTDYWPDMNAIQYCYHFFSYADFVQPVLGTFKRVLPEHERIANINITINQQEPSHSGMHDPLIAQWLPLIHEVLQFQKIGNFTIFDFKQPGTIHFTTNQIPYYEIDHEREELLMCDTWVQQQLALAYERTVYEEKNY